MPHAGSGAQLVLPLAQLAVGFVAGDAVALLDPPQEQVAITFGGLDVVVGQFRPLLADATGHLLPVAGDLIPVHLG